MKLTKFRLPSWRLIIANALMLGLAAFFGVSLVREVSRARPLPPPRAQQPPAAAPAASAEPAAVAEDRLDSYNVIVVKHLFSPSRSEKAAAPTAAAAVAPLVKPLLHGVVVDGAASLAYLEDPSSKRVMVYRVGDAVAGGKLVQINQDRVSISRADSQVDVLLKDPGKPQPAPTGAAPAAGATPPNGGQRAPSTRPSRIPPAAETSPPAAQAPATVEGAQPQSGVRVPGVRVPRGLTPSEIANPPTSSVTSED